MISIELLVVLLAGTILMCIPISIQMKWYSVARWKSIVISAVLVLTGVIGSEIWFFVENLSFGGRSFYGAVVFAPIVFIPVARLLRISYGDVMDFVAPAGCLTLAMVKLQCLKDHCCEGKILYIDENHMYVRFPSQIVELIVFLIISIALMLISANKKSRNRVFPWFLIIYGAARFGLDFMRDNAASYAFGLSAGSFWSLCAFVIGIIVLMIMSRKQSNV